MPRRTSFDRVARRVLLRSLFGFSGRFPLLIGRTIDADRDRAEQEERELEMQERGPPGAELTEEQREQAVDDYVARHPPEP